MLIQHLIKTRKHYVQFLTTAHESLSLFNLQFKKDNMESNRRLWLKQIGLGVAGLGLANIQPFALPTQGFLKFSTNDLPIKLSSNENPYGPSPLARAAMIESINISNRYNGQLTKELIQTLSEKNNVKTNNILMGAGSTEMLDLVTRLSALKKGSFIIADPSYNNWTNTAEKLGLTKIKVPLTADKKLNLDAMLKAITPDTKLIYICNPNNPTGSICDRDQLVKFINEATKKTIVLVDEAYIDFTEQQSLSAVAIENKNLIIVKTFSKIYGLAGARIGYAIANDKTIEQLSELKTWSIGGISVASLAAALASLKDEKFASETYSLNQKARQYTTEHLKKLNLVCIPSNTNFLYFSLTNYKNDYFEQLKTNNIIGTKMYEEQGKWTRITVGTMQEMQKFISAIV
jgi:histidinol-phosphate aminotransferase